jgi:hypothetical protein
MHRLHEGSYHGQQMLRREEVRVVYKFVTFRFGTGTSNTSNRSPLNALPFLIGALLIILFVHENMVPL